MAAATQAGSGSNMQSCRQASTMPGDPRYAVFIFNRCLSKADSGSSGYDSAQDEHMQQLLVLSGLGHRDVPGMLTALTEASKTMRRAPQSC